MPGMESHVEVVPEDLESPTSHTQQQHKAKTDPKTKRQPPYAVILHNDPINTMEFVVGVLRKVFHYSRTKSLWLMLKAHVTGKSVVWTGSLEVAELKAEQLKSCGPDPTMKCHGATALHVTIEALPQ